MAWQFTTWKTLNGTGGKTAVILIIAGSIGLLSKPWAERTPAHYFTTRDAAEIVARAGEQENAMRFQLIAEYAPLGAFGVAGYNDWHGYFASTNGAFTTNAVDRYAQRKLWAGLETDQDNHFNLTPGNETHRRWVDLWQNNGVFAYDQAAPFSVLQGAIGAIDAPFAMNVGWWKTNIYDGVTWYPFTNANYVTAIEKTRGDLAAVGRAFSSARWTIEYGQVAPAFQVGANAIDSVDVLWTADATNSIATSFLDLAVAAWSELQSADAELVYASTFTADQLAAMLPYCLVYAHAARIYMYETGTNATPRYRKVTFTESVSASVSGAITIGTNCTAYGIGRRIAYQTETENQIYHALSGYAEQPWLLLEQCGDPEQVCRVWGGTNTVLNAWLHINPSTAWDGRFPDDPYLLLAQYPFAPPTSSSTSTNIYFGWESVNSNQAFVIDWHFNHITNRGAFFP